MAKRKGKTQGARRMQELGYRPVQLWLSQTEHAALSEAARLEGRKLTPYIHRAALVAAAAAGVTAELLSDQLVILVSIKPPGGELPLYHRVPYEMAREK